MRINLLKMWPLNHFSGEYWEEEAAKLPKNGWRVGRTDMYTYLPNGTYVHYAYPPEKLKINRVPFLGTPLSGLRKAVKYAKKMNEKAQARTVARYMDC